MTSFGQPNKYHPIKILSDNICSNFGDSLYFACFWHNVKRCILRTGNKLVLLLNLLDNFVWRFAALGHVMKSTESFIHSAGQFRGQILSVEFVCSFSVSCVSYYDLYCHSTLLFHAASYCYWPLSQPCNLSPSISCNRWCFLLSSSCYTVGNLSK